MKYPLTLEKDMLQKLCSGAAIRIKKLLKNTEGDIYNYSTKTVN